MEVILLEKVAKLGSIGSVVTVKDGYGRNFLLPRNKAVRATQSNLKMFEARRQEIERENKMKKDAAEALLPKFSDVSVTLLRQAGEDGRLFGSVSSRDIAQAITDVVGLNVEYSQVVVPSKFKQVGTYSLSVELHPEVVAEISLVIARGEEEVSK
jgi:large subunit ribosomal protein L9